MIKKLLHNINLYCKSSTQTRNTNVCMLNVEIFVFQRQILLKCPYIKLYSFWVTNERQKKNQEAIDFTSSTANTKMLVNILT